MVIGLDTKPLEPTMFPKTNDFNDDLSDLTGSPSTQRADYFQADNGYKSPVLHTEKCPACRGSGKFVSYSGRIVGNCFKCKGKGERTFRTSSQARAQARTSAADRKVRTAESNLADFAAAQPEISAWMTGSTFPFAMAMVEAVKKFGSLTPNQMAACHRGIEKLAAAKAAAAERVTNAPVVEQAGVDRLQAAFDKAIAFTAAKQTDTGMPLRMRNPKITIGGITISPAKATSANAGALYVKDHGEYVGKIMNGKFFATRECSPEAQTRVLSFLADPKAAAEAYGQETGICCICNATLRSEWRLRGIGPICSAKYGW
jgi:hypothetical protein